MSDTSPAALVAVVTVSYGSADVLEGFLTSLPAATTRPMRTLVVDNLPTAEASVEPIATAAGALWLPADNPGYGGAVNLALRELDPEVEWVLVSNPDVVLGPGAIDALIAAAGDDRRIAAVGPAILNEDGSVYPSARRLPSLRHGIGHALFADVWPANPWTRDYRAESGTVGRRFAGWLSGSCFLIRRAVFDELGGFDQGYFMYFEDVDLGLRIRQAGYLSLYAPEARAQHLGAHSTRESRPAMIAAHHASARRYLERKYAGPWLAPLRLLIRLSLSAREAVETRRARSTPRDD